MPTAFSDQEVEKIIDERDDLLDKVIRLEDKVHHLEFQEANLQAIINGMADRIAAQSELLSRRAEK